MTRVIACYASESSSTLRRRDSSSCSYCHVGSITFPGSKSCWRSAFLSLVLFFQYAYEAQVFLPPAPKSPDIMRPCVGIRCPGKKQGKAALPGTCEIFEVKELHVNNTPLLKRCVLDNFHAAYSLSPDPQPCQKKHRRTFRRHHSVIAAGVPPRGIAYAVLIVSTWMPYGIFHQSVSGRSVRLDG